MDKTASIRLVALYRKGLAGTTAPRSSCSSLASPAIEGFTMNHDGWIGGGMWIWTVIAVLVIVLLVVVINRVSKK
jgi:hypothetical protein